MKFSKSFDILNKMPDVEGDVLDITVTYDPESHIVYVHARVYFPLFSSFDLEYKKHASMRIYKRICKKYYLKSLED